MLAQLPAGLQATQRDRNKTLEIPSASQRHSVMPPSDDPIRSHCCMVDVFLIQTYALSPGRGPPEPTSDSPAEARP